ncbi:MAG TPA: acyl-ACP thioesterase domain-containing protein [Acidimicrobiales bacterium]|nr:acyl-ACP thioesterase domain-containing protein [Acidimicrobiales bacterium]
MIDFVPVPQSGRRFSHSRRVHLGDVGPEGSLRPDALARYLQDVAGDDWDDAVGADEDTWVVRRTSVRVAEGGRWPTLGEHVTVSTWCGGTGAAWAERRSDVTVEGRTLIDATALWVPVGPDGRPRRVRRDFIEIYGESAARKVSGRVDSADLDAAAPKRPWPIRRSDLDIVGHVNNAAVWEAVSEVAGPAPRAATVVHLGSLEAGDDVRLAVAARRMWLVVDGAVRVAGEFDA